MQRFLVLLSLLWTLNFNNLSLKDDVSLVMKGVWKHENIQLHRGLDWLSADWILQKSIKIHFTVWSYFREPFYRKTSRDLVHPLKRIKREQSIATDIKLDSGKNVWDHNSKQWVLLIKNENQANAINIFTTMRMLITPFHMVPSYLALNSYLQNTDSEHSMILVSKVWEQGEKKKSIKQS